MSTTDTTPVEVGLTNARALELLAAVGHNVLPEAEHIPAWRQLIGQFVHFFAVLLWVAAALALIGGMPAPRSR